jgi:transcriptional regulator with XRE-family HTH domain
VPKDQSLADHIRCAAEESGLSVYRIARETGLDQSALNRFLNGTRDNVRLDVADRLFQFLGLRVLPRRRKEHKGGSK